MRDEEKLKNCPECGSDLIKEPYEEYLYCPDCGWDEENGSLDADMEDVGFDDTSELFPDIDEDDLDTNFDPEAGEDA